MDDDRAEKIHEIARLRDVAEWYRDWARQSGSEPVRQARLSLALTAEAKARALQRALERQEQPAG
jgi:hypothetical protein